MRKTDVIKLKPESCKKCPLYSMGDGFVRGDGPLPNSILLVGEAPGETEAIEGKPFVGVAGKLLDRLLHAAGLDRAAFRVANVLCCRPPRNFLNGAPYEVSAVSSCHPFLEEEITQASPRVIVAMGNSALKRLCGVSGISRYRGFPLRHRSGAWVVPTYHPSFLLPRIGQKESAKLTGLVVMDILRAKEISEKGFESAKFEDYVLDPRPETAEVWAAEAENGLASGSAIYLSVDIETPGRMRTSEEEDFDVSDEEPEDRDDEFGSIQILRIGYAYAPGKVLSIPYSTPYLHIHRRLLLNPDAEFIFWNGYAFDLPILSLNGLTVRGTAKHDGMWAWHTLQSDLPRGLEAVTSIYAPEIGPWKHLAGGQPALYNGIDADAALRNFIGIRQDLEKNDQWKVYVKHVVELHPILFKAGRIHGVGIDRFAQNTLRGELEEDRDHLLRKAQEAVGAFRVKPPKTWRSRLLAEKSKKSPLVEVDGTAAVWQCPACEKLRVTKKHFIGGCAAATPQRVTVPVKKWAWVPEWDTLSGDALVEAVDLCGFNPVSTKQLQAYARAQGHALPKDYKTGREQLNNRARKQLIKRYGERHPIYAIAQKLQTITKTLGTYVVGYAPDSKGRIYTTYTFAPSSGRLSSANKNLQNVTHSGSNPYATPIRRTIVPTQPGWWFVECDSSAIEAVLTGYFMNDPFYVDLARKGVHDYITCLEFGKEFDPLAVKEYRKDPLYEAARDRNKRVIHGCLTKDAEVLTPEGWVRFEDYNFTTPLAEWEPLTREVKFRSPKGRYTRWHEGEMVALQGRYLRTLVTPDHGMPVMTSAGNVRRYPAKALPKANSIPTCGVLEDGVLPDLDDIRRMVAIAADGSLYGNVARFHVKNRRKIARLKELGGTFIAPSSDKPGAEYWKVVGIPPGLTAEKTFDLPYLLRLHAVARTAFLRELPLWDGDGKRIYRTSLESQARIVQTIAHVTGQRVTLRFRPASVGAFGTRGYWEVCFSPTKSNKHVALESLTRTPVEDFSGPIYCPVTESGYFLVRERGTVFVSGNTSYGMTPKMMMMQFPEQFRTEREAAFAQGRFLEAIPSLPKWQHEVRVTAHRQQYLVNPWGWRHYYYQVFTKNAEGKVVNGPDAKRAVAFLPQSSAAAIMKDTLLLLGESEWKDFTPANLSIHDSVCLAVPPERVEEAIEWLTTTMSRPIPELGGLQIGCEAKVGRNWADMEVRKKISF